MLYLHHWLHTVQLHHWLHTVHLYYWLHTVHLHHWLHTVHLHHWLRKVHLHHWLHIVHSHKAIVSLVAPFEPRENISGCNYWIPYQNHHKYRHLNHKKWNCNRRPHLWSRLLLTEHWRWRALCTLCRHRYEVLDLWNFQKIRFLFQKFG